MTDLPLFGIKSMLAPALAAGQTTFLLCYLPFGIVRGQIVAPDDSEAGATTASSADEGLMIELRDAVVEHYSNHLPTGHYPRLHLRLSDISGCVLLND